MKASELLPVGGTEVSAEILEALTQWLVEIREFVSYRALAPADATALIAAFAALEKTGSVEVFKKRLRRN